jgi:hypothetical protein
MLGFLGGFAQLFVLHMNRLQYNDNEHNMTCSLCIQYSNASTNKSSNLKNKNLFVTGCKNFRFSTVVDHENSKGHKDSCAKQTAEQNPPKFVKLLTTKDD